MPSCPLELSGYVGRDVNAYIQLAQQFTSVSLDMTLVLGGTLQSLSKVQRSWHVTTSSFCYIVTKSIETNPMQNKTSYIRTICSEKSSFRHLDSKMSWSYTFYACRYPVSVDHSMGCLTGYEYACVHRTPVSISHYWHHLFTPGLTFSVCSG